MRPDLPERFAADRANALSTLEDVRNFALELTIELDPPPIDQLFVDIERVRKLISGLQYDERCMRAWSKETGEMLANDAIGRTESDDVDYADARIVDAFGRAFPHEHPFNFVLVRWTSFEVSRIRRRMRLLRQSMESLKYGGSTSELERRLKEFARQLPLDQDRNRPESV